MVPFGSFHFGDYKTGYKLYFFFFFKKRGHVGLSCLNVWEAAKRQQKHPLYETSGKWDFRLTYVLVNKLEDCFFTGNLTVFSRKKPSGWIVGEALISLTCLSSCRRKQNNNNETSSKFQLVLTWEQLRMLPVYDDPEAAQHNYQIGLHLLCTWTLENPWIYLDPSGLRLAVADIDWDPR